MAGDILQSIVLILLSIGLLWNSWQIGRLYDRTRRLDNRLVELMEVLGFKKRED